MDAILDSGSTPLSSTIINFIKHKNMLYSVKAIVFATKLGKDFGKTVHTTVLADNKDQAFDEADKSLKNYCAALERDHNNNFSFTNLIIE